MNHVKVTNSSNVDTIGYDEQTQTLEVRYLGKTPGLGSLYSYQPVPVVLHMQLMAAHSKGQYLSKHVKNNPNFKCVRVDESIKINNDPSAVDKLEVTWNSRSEEKRVRTLRGDQKPLEPRPPKNVGHGVVDDERLK